MLQRVRKSYSTGCLLIIANGLWFVSRWEGRCLLHSKYTVDKGTAGTVAKPHSQTCPPHHSLWMKLPVHSEGRNLAARVQFGTVQLSLLKRQAVCHWVWGLGTSNGSLILSLLPPLAHSTTWIILFTFGASQCQSHSGQLWREAAYFSKSL